MATTANSTFAVFWGFPKVSLLAEVAGIGQVPHLAQPADAMLGKARFGGEKRRARIPPTEEKRAPKRAW